MAILSLTLGIGANTAMFTVLDGVLLKSLPVEDPERLAMLTDPDKRGQGSRYCYRFYTELREHNTIFSGVLARAYWEHDYPIYVSINGGPIEKTTLELNSGDFFNVLGVRPYIGRTLSPQDDRIPGNPVAVLSHRYWSERFAADPQVIGKTILLRNHPFTIIGVTPPDFFGIEVGSSPAIRIPLTTATTLWPQPKEAKANENYLDDPSLGMNHTDYLQLVGRLKPGVSLQQAEAALRVLNQQIREQEAQSPNWHRTSMKPL